VKPPDFAQEETEATESQTSHDGLIPQSREIPIAPFSTNPHLPWPTGFDHSVLSVSACATSRLSGGSAFFCEPHGGAEQDEADGEAGDVGVLTEEKQRAGDGERDLGVVHHGKGAAADSGHANVPEKEPDA
jgi:hypothetical protein